MMRKLSERLRTAAKTAEAGSYPMASMLSGWAEEAERMERLVGELRDWRTPPPVAKPQHGRLTYPPVAWVDED